MCGFAAVAEDFWCVFLGSMECAILAIHTGLVLGFRAGVSSVDILRRHSPKDACSKAGSKSVAVDGLAV